MTNRRGGDIKNKIHFIFNKQFKTEGLILRRISLNEGDLILTLFTREHGKIDCIAKSARRLKIRFMGRLQLFQHVEVELFSGRNLENINEAEVLSASAEWGRDLPGCGIAFFITEITHRLLQSGQPIPAAYTLFQEALKRLSEKIDPEETMYAYLIQLFGILGFMPSWKVCSQCGKGIDLNFSIFLDGSGLAVRCRACDAGATCSAAFCSLIQSLQIQIVSIPASERDPIWQWLKNVLRELLPYEVRSGKFAEAMLRD